MSFSQRVKMEISQNVLFECCQRAQLAALVLFVAKIIINDQGICLQIETENSKTAKRIWQLIKDLFDVEVKLTVVKKPRFNRANTYQINIVEEALMVLDELGLFDANKALVKIPRKEVIEDECCQRAYLAGAFLASGSVNSPHNSNYHLEITANNPQQVHLVQRLMNEIDLNAKIVERRNNLVVYLKSSEKISDFLRAVGASNSVMEYENIRIERDFTSNITRINNCDIANETRAVAAAQRHLEDIQLIEDTGLMVTVEENLLEVIELRRDYPEDTLLELTARYQERFDRTISKSGMNHRFKAIKAIADKIRDRG